jgi:hypothetical protein
MKLREQELDRNRREKMGHKRGTFSLQKQNIAVENSMYYAEASALSQDGVHKLFDKAVSMRAKKTPIFCFCRENVPRL